MQNAKMSDYSKRDSTVFAGLSMYQREEEERYNYWRGLVRHELGYAAFTQYIEYSDSGIKHKSLSITIISDGRSYCRYWKAWYGEKTIARLANEFIEEIKEG